MVMVLMILMMIDGDGADDNDDAFGANDGEDCDAVEDDECYGEDDDADDDDHSRHGKPYT